MTVDQYAAVELNFDLGGQQLQQWSAENDFNLTDNLAKQYEPLEVRVARVCCCTLTCTCAHKCIPAHYIHVCVFKLALNALLITFAKTSFE